VTDTRQLVASFAARLDARDWEGLTALLHPELLYEMPQSGERIRGRDRYVAFNAEYPGSWNVVPQLILADDTDGCLLFRWVTADGDDPAIAFFRFDGGIITRVTDFFPAPFEPPSGREHLVQRQE
jgi:hypothetical protein